MGVNGISSNKQNKLENFHFTIKKEVYDEMITYCQSALPNESCGLLSNINLIGSSIWRIKNESINPNRFYMPAESIKHAVENIEKKGEKLSGIFHSHPSTPAIPSSHDIKNNPYANLAYLIVSFYKGKVDVGCFMMNGKTVIPLKLIIIDE